MHFLPLKKGREALQVATGCADELILLERASIVALLSGSYLILVNFFKALMLDCVTAYTH
jgi:hypothetical protein